MDIDLEALIAADDDARARVDLARAAARAAIETANQERALRLERQAEAARQALARDVAQVEDDANRTIAARRRAREVYAAARREAADAALPEAAAALAAVIRGDASQ